MQIGGEGIKSWLVNMVLEKKKKTNKYVKT
jgi:hypothetical protein